MFLAERRVALTFASLVLVTFLFLVIKPRAMDSATLAIVRFLAATFAGVSGYLFSGDLGLEAKIPLTKVQVRATGAFAAFVLVLVIFFVGIPSSSELLKDPKAGKFSIGGIVLAETGDHFRVEINVYNPLNHDVIVTGVKMTRSSWGGIACYGATSYKYVLSGQISADSKVQNGFTFSIPVLPQGDLAGYQYQARGSASSFCTSDIFEIEFDSLFPVDNNSNTSLLIDVPKVLNVKQAIEKPFNGEAKALPIKHISVELTPDSNREEYKTFDIEVELNTNIGLVNFTKKFFD